MWRTRRRRGNSVAKPFLQVHEVEVTVASGAAALVYTATVPSVVAVYSTTQSPVITATVVAPELIDVIVEAR